MQRFSNHLILLALVGLFVLGVQVLGAGEETAADDPLEVLVEAPLPVANGGTTAAVSESAAVPILPTIDLTRVPILSDNSLAPELDPITFVGKKPVHDFPTYVVEAGDAPENIATRFGISTETILGGNPRLSNEASALQTGTELVILPIDGVLHTVERGETLESISTRYGISTEEIIAYADNNLEFPYRLYPETQLLIPGALPEIGFVWNPPSLASIRGNNSPDIGGGNSNFLVQGTGSHVWPISARNITQGYWVGHPGLDIGASEGSSVVASDRGTVTWAAWNTYCYGNLVVINHGNGFETFYAHLSSINVRAGQIVQKGQYIGGSGNTGCSSGPHLHYEIRYNTARDNPYNYLP